LWKKLQNSHRKKLTETILDDMKPTDQYQEVVRKTFIKLFKRKAVDFFAVVKDFPREIGSRVNV
jgi:hypothetical protein